MASAGGDGGRANNPTGARTQRFTIPLPRPLQPGQRVMVRMVPAVQVPGANGVRVIRPAHAHVHVVNAGGQPQQQQPSPQAQNIIRQQQELQQQLEIARREEQRQKEELKSKLCISELPEIEYKGTEDSLLSWKPILDVTPTPLTYNALLYTDEKKDGQEIYSGSECQCSVESSRLLPGHVYQFSVCASVSGVSGERSPRCTLEVPALPPAKPLPPKVGTRSKGSLTLRWNAPADNGSPITCYELEWDQCRGEWDQLNSDKTKQFKFNHRFSPSSVAEFRIRASNKIGWSELSDVLVFHSGAGPPSAPSKPHAVQAGADYINVSWTAPNANGAEVTCYKLEKDDIDGGHGFIPEYNGPDMSYQCSGLRPNTQYKFRVSAQNEKGWSQCSPTATLSTAAGLCGSPGTPYLKERATSTSLHIAWSPPTHTGGVEVQSYVLEVDSSGELSGEEMVEVFRGPNDNHLMEGLLPGRRYLCQVCALTEAGRGKWSPVAHLRTPATKPSPPSSLSLVSEPTKTSVKLEWGYPLSDGGATVTSYTVECKQASSEDSWRAVATVGDPQTFGGHTPTSTRPSLSHTVTQLQPGEEYLLRVFCQNSVGVSHPSVECPLLTAPGEPDPPTSLEVANLAATSVQLHWKPSVTHGCPAESYEVQCSCDGKLTTLSALSPVCTISNLHCATSYQARARALSVAGSSEWSVMITFTTAPSTPSPPTHLTMVNRTPFSMLIAWASPRDNGAPITAYHVEYSSGQSVLQSQEISPLETQYNIIDLKPSTSYRYRVRAENSVGKGSFGGYGTSSTLPPPPSPPLLTLASATHHTLKITWGKKTNRALSFTLHLATRGKQFHEVYSGSAVSHRLTRLQPDTEYVLRVAATSESGQGAWSDDVTFSTTPSPPPAPTDLVLRQESNDTMKLCWQPGGEMPYSVGYEVQVSSLVPGEDFIQAYKGDKLECSLPVTSYDRLTEARVRCWTVVSVNGRNEQLWSPFSPTSHCQCIRESWTDVPDVKEEKSVGAEVKQDKASVTLSPQTMAMVAFIVVTLLTLVLAFVLGQYAV